MRRQLENDTEMVRTSTMKVVGVGVGFVRDVVVVSKQVEVVGVW